MKIINGNSCILTSKEAREKEWLEDNDFIHCCLCDNTDDDIKWWFYSKKLDRARGDYICWECISKIHVKMLVEIK